MSRGSQVVASFTLAAAMLAVGLVRIASAVSPTSSAAMAATPPLPTPPPQLVEMDKNSALILIRSALIAVQQANQTGDYTVLYKLSAPGFQKVNTPERLSQSFARLRAKNFDLSGILVLEPQFTVMPEMYSNGIMRMAGFFPSVPIQVFFELQFAPVQGHWRLIAVGVDVGASTLAAPTPNPALASSYSPTPAPAATAASSATPTPTPSPTPVPPTVEVRPPTKPTPTPRKKQTGGTRQSLGRETPGDH